MRKRNDGCCGKRNWIGYGHFVFTRTCFTDPSPLVLYTYSNPIRVCSRGCFASAQPIHSEVKARIHLVPKTRYHCSLPVVRHCHFPAGSKRNRECHMSFGTHSPLGTGWERSRSGRTLRQFYRKSSNLESQARRRTEEFSTKLNIKKRADYRIFAGNTGNKPILQ